MRYIIYGAGGIGSIMGGHLARTGHDVILIGRPGHVNVINERGLRLVTPTETYMLQIPAVTGPDKIDFTLEDVIFLCMKGQDTEPAVRELKRFTEDLPVFSFQNGVRNEEITSRYFSRVYGVMVRVGAVYLEDGEVLARRDPPGWYVIGRYPKGLDEFAEAVSRDLREAGYFVKTVEDVMPYKWGKLMANLNNAIDAIADTDFGSVPELRGAVFEEARSIVEKAGIVCISQEEVDRDWSEITAPLRGQIKTEAKSSTWQSLTRGRDTVETEFMNGEIVRVAASIGLKAPLNEKLLVIMQEMAANREPPGKYTTDQLSEMLRIDVKE